MSCFFSSIKQNIFILTALHLLLQSAYFFLDIGDDDVDTGVFLPSYSMDTINQQLSNNDHLWLPFFFGCYLKCSHKIKCNVIFKKKIEWNKSYWNTTKPNYIFIL